MKKKRFARITALVLAIAMIASTAIYIFMMLGGLFGSYAAYAAESELTEEQQYRIDILEDLMRYIKTNYNDEISYDDLIKGLYGGLMDSLDDKWSTYYFADDSEAESLYVSLDNEFYGVGISMTEREEGYHIEAITPGSPAEEAGVPDDGYIVSVDGIDSSEFASLTELVLKVRGENGTKVTLGIKTVSGIKEYTLTRRKIRSASLSYKLLEDKIGYIDINSFSLTTAEEFETARKELLEKGMTGLIIDLRNNGGGYIDQAWEIADQLMDEGICGYYMRQGKVIQTIKSYANDTKKVPIVVLTNENTASASEALTAALKDSNTATVVGEPTFGKGEAQQQVNLTNDDELKISVFYFTGSSKKNIHKEGIIPDEIVYSYGGYTASDASKIVNSIVPLNENERYYEGEYGLNVLAAQQRLTYLGYEVEPTGIMDEKTIAALKKVQRKAGSYAYGNLDNFTIKALKEQFLAILGLSLNGSEKDVQLQKAIEVLKR